MNRAKDALLINFGDLILSKITVSKIIQGSKNDEFAKSIVLSKAQGKKDPLVIHFTKMRDGSEELVTEVASVLTRVDDPHNRLWREVRQFIQ